MKNGAATCSYHLQLGIHGARGLMACRMASRSWGVAPSEFSARTTSVSWGELGMLMTLPGSCLTWISDFCATTVCPCENGAGWLMTGVVLMVMEIAVRNRAGTQGHGLIEHDGAGAGIDDHLGRRLGGLDGHLLNLGDHAHARARIDGALTCTVRPSKAMAVPAPMRWLMARTILSAVWKSV